MKFLIRAGFVLAFCCSVMIGQTSNITVTMNMTFNPAILADVNLYWTQQRAGTLGATSSGISNTATGFTMSAASSTAPTVGQALVLDNGATMEAVVVTSVSLVNGVISVGIQRNVIPAIGGVSGPYGAVAHSSGVAVYLLKFPSPYAMAADQLRKWVVSVSQSLGTSSVVFGNTATGSVTAQ